MQFFVEILSHTPIWVWIVLTALMALGLTSTRARSRSYTALIIPALVFAMIAIAKLALARFDGVTTLGTLASGFIAIAIVAVTRPARFTEKLENGKYLIKGEWMSLAVILAVFSVNYVSAVLAATAPEVAASTGMVLVTAATNGFSAFFMAGRTIAHLRAGRTEAATDRKLTVEGA